MLYLKSKAGARTQYEGKRKENSRLRKEVTARMDMPTMPSDSPSMTGPSLKRPCVLEVDEGIEEEETQTLEVLPPPSGPHHRDDGFGDDEDVVMPGAGSLTSTSTSSRSALVPPNVVRPRPELDFLTRSSTFLVATGPKSKRRLARQ